MRFDLDVVWRALFFYFRYPLSLREVSELMADRGVRVHHSTIYRWILKFGPILEARFRRHKLPVSTSWKLDETYIRVNSKWKYLYRAVDKHGQTIDFLLTAKRDRKAARRFLKKAIKNNGQPNKINIDKSGANKLGITLINKCQRPQIEIRQVKFLNNLVEQDHRAIKRQVKPMMSFKSFHSAKTIIAGIEVLNMIFKGQSGYLRLLCPTPRDAYWALVRA